MPLFLCLIDMAFVSRVTYIHLTMPFTCRSVTRPVHNAQLTTPIYLS